MPGLLASHFSTDWLSWLELGNQVGSTTNHLPNYYLPTTLKDQSTVRPELTGIIAKRGWGKCNMRASSESFLPNTCSNQTRYFSLIILSRRSRLHEQTCRTRRTRDRRRTPAWLSLLVWRRPAVASPTAGWLKKKYEKNWSWIKEHLRHLPIL